MYIVAYFLVFKEIISMTTCLVAIVRNMIQKKRNQFIFYFIINRHYCCGI